MTTTGRIILFDGVCNLCNATIQFVIRHSRNGQFHFSSLQGKTAAALRTQFPAIPSGDKGLSSIVLVENGKVYTRSSAVLRICSHLKGAWSLLYVFIAVPKFIRDFFYNIIARYRYTIFGRTESCMLPSEDTKRLFLE